MIINIIIILVTPCLNACLPRLKSFVRAVRRAAHPRRARASGAGLRADSAALPILALLIYYISDTIAVTIDVSQPVCD